MKTNRSQKSEVRSQTADSRKHFLLTSFFCLSFVLCFLSSASMAVSWDAGDVLETFLGDNFPWEKIEVSNVRVIGTMPDEAPDTITIEKGPLGNSIFSFTFDKYQKVIVRADVRAFDKVVKSKWPLKKGYVLKTDDLYLSEINVYKMPKGLVKDPETIVGKALNRSVLANMSLTSDMVEISQVVDKGKKVALVYSAHGFNITAAGETREKGHVGMPVKAINLSSKKEVRGVLIDERTIEVEL